MTESRQDSSVKSEDTCVNIKEECVEDIELQPKCPVWEDVIHLEENIERLSPDFYIDKNEAKQENPVSNNSGRESTNHLSLGHVNFENDGYMTEEPESTFIKTTEMHVDQTPSSKGEKNNIYSPALIDYEATEFGSLTTPKLKPFSCEHCHKRFNRCGHLTEHMRIHTGEKPFSCEICNKGFSTNENLKTHVRSHTGEKPYACDVCNKSFSTSGYLKAHARIHTGEKPYSCDICQKSFTRSGGLRSHMQSHIGEKPYRCDSCNKSFSTRFYLQTHMRCIHRGEKPYSCDICNISFSHGESLKRHMKIHTGEKPHACDICKDSFLGKSDLNRHMKVHREVNP